MHIRTHTPDHQVQDLVAAREQLSREEAPGSQGGKATPTGKASESPSARRQERAIWLSIEGLYKLFEGLQAIMASQSYMEVRLG